MKIVLMLTVLLLAVMIYRWYGGVNRAYKNQVRKSMAAVQNTSEVITEEDLIDLPDIIQKYMIYSGVIGTERVTHFKVICKGSMRLNRESEWAPVTAEQYSFINEGRRLFNIAMTYKGLQISGLHHFYNGNAWMTIKIFDLIQVVHNEGVYMKAGETVTWFNDMCIMAPGALLDADVQWEEIDDTHVKGIMTNDGVTVSAILTIDDQGRLVNFISEDRYAANNDGTYDNIPWSTPMYEFRNINGLNLGCQGEAIWHYADGDFTYIQLEIVDVVINPSE